ncbi:hypothetical protein QOT92_26740 [Pseudomonas aeruginosa]|uniref:hypothetical protein n=1 Tax=Pseudomonas aeruginosa TaxID=287 RepID=UPI0011C41FAA|nr:hypothetical protein [Pseudomonas aeruginosa]HBP1117326.1 hypothetical protein [Pseudomonas aeruginosa]HCE9325939.1 hypothetical protein [Pseudomonas aeruginosa]HCE9445576.1 hypothetical protein [Pseudomonas aeruginosa]
MSSGYQAGLSAGYANSRAVQSSYESAIEEWRAYSENLKRTINTLNERIEIMQGHFEANDFVLCLLLDELQKVSPGSPLLSKEYRDSIRQREFNEFLADKGYEQTRLRR